MVTNKFLLQTNSLVFIVFLFVSKGLQKNNNFISYYQNLDTKPNLEKKNGDIFLQMESKATDIFYTAYQVKVGKP